MHVLCQHYVGVSECLSITQKIHEEICIKSGLDYVISQENFTNNYYAKAILLDRFLKAGADSVTYLDHDCIILTNKINVLDYTNNEFSLFAAPCEIVSGDLNTGVIIVRRMDSRTELFLRKWIEMQNLALRYQDQGAFNILFKYHSEFAGVVGALPTVLNSRNPDNKSVIAGMHGYSDKRSRILSIINGRGLQ